ncbi:MAG: dihydrolipoamide acyltransferase [Altererythrobacter sp.]|uniref:lipoyl domain-containing protein n=1 Tax=uncultured Altererythrobacter sp. TaxID=500840 RepID=UPI0017BC2F8C|nr:lipoyl domain-containing protein [uncultured Altererythrobacter sp.]MBT8389673.1 lipoyl domain-containing protein [Altererythrobacter sp.]MBT8431728.1 lipoyl domain-containing protein [Altererythrobacter sp.]NNE50127.1 dihydrolipoamide acyltransferase [Altererythrobacter sp.]NNF94663.1 dihydrolipoamide acyltransferase [Altererythrobacter sp.]NNK45865.1 dihydrolipoamide acyltransferase [Altererythrobacter sp.]
MAEEIRIPKLGMSATEVTLSEWMFGDGEAVSKGDVIYTAETDKTTVEIEAQASGVIRPTGEEGVKYKVGDVIGTIE